MSTACYKPSEAHAPPFEIPTGAAKRSAVLVKTPSRLNLRDTSRVCDHSQCSDDDLISATQGGDQQAFVELCRRHSALAKKRIQRILRNREDAEDALQDTLLQAYTHLASFRGSCKFSTWLTAIGVNSALMIVRKRKVRRETTENTGGSDCGKSVLLEHADRSPGPEGIYLRKQTFLLVRREVKKLKPTLRYMVDRYYWSEDSLEESANTLGITSGAAKSRLMRGRTRLRSMLARYGVSNSRT